MDRLFDIDIGRNDSTEGLVVVIEGVGRKVALFVDDVLTQQQVVIKSLGNGLEKTPFVSGGAIMSDGTVGLILNVEEIASLVDKRSSRPLEAAINTVGRLREDDDPDSTISGMPGIASDADRNTTEREVSL
jgi:chemotaxis protein histidine kinase CheA